MKIIQLTPGAGAMYCGNCLRDNAMVASMRRAGHDAFMIPLYLPLTLDESDLSQDQPVFFSGINVYLEQVMPWMRHMPGWLHKALTSRRLLKMAAGKAAATRPEQVGELTLSMLRGEEGNQARELDELVKYIQTVGKPDVICLSNAMLIGMARQLHEQVEVPVVCMLQGEDDFLDALPARESAMAWELIRERSDCVAAFVAPTRYFASRMSERLALPNERVHIIPNGIHPQGFRQSNFQQPATIGFFARMCKEKGLESIIRAFIILRQSGQFDHVKLAVGGSCGPTDQVLVDAMTRELKSAGLVDSVSFHPNLTREEKQEFLSKLHVFSVPASYSEAFGLYLLEAMAAGVPCVQPRASGFPEIIENDGAGWIYEPHTPEALAEALTSALKNPEELKARGQNAHSVLQNKFHIDNITHKYLELFQTL